MPPFIPDIPYKIQGIFIGVFSYIWATAFIDNYLEEVPLEGEARTEILVRFEFNELINRERTHGEV
jgi:hypothetical protein